ncbi:type IIL restriction-modification enzyme MmeI [Corynebacterium sp. KPL4072]|uniref:type IIL restriction-modification enzyme MmeI n=1 Tax=Corynebacterium sp. KPL4072 TaxID=3135440 RepID=UPI0030C99647
MGGRIKSDLRFRSTLTWNTFPVPERVKLFVCGGRFTISILVACCTCRCRKPRVYRGGALRGLGYGSPYQIRKI